MQVSLSGKVGPGIAVDGNRIPFRIGKNGEPLASESHGRYYEQTFRNGTFYVAGGTATSTGTAAIWSGFGLSNPFGSNVNVVIQKAFCIPTSALTATSIGVMYGKTPVSVARGNFGSPSNGFLAGPAAKAIQMQSATFSTSPVILDTFCFGGSNLSGLSVLGLSAAATIDFEGSVIIPPDYALASYTSAATSGLFFAFQWEEVSLG